MNTLLILFCLIWSILMVKTLCFRVCMEHICEHHASPDIYYLVVSVFNNNITVKNRSAWGNPKNCRSRLLASEPECGSTWDGWKDSVKLVRLSRGWVACAGAGCRCSSEGGEVGQPQLKLRWEVLNQFWAGLWIGHRVPQVFFRNPNVPQLRSGCYSMVLL